MQSLNERISSWTFAYLIRVFMLFLAAAMLAASARAAENYYQILDKEIIRFANEAIDYAKNVYGDGSARAADQAWLLLPAMIEHRESVLRQSGDDHQAAPLPVLTVSGVLEKLIVDSHSNGVLAHRTQFQLLQNTQVTRLAFIQPTLAESLFLSGQQNVSFTGMMVDDYLLVLNTDMPVTTETVNNAAVTSNKTISDENALPVLTTIAAEESVTTSAMVESAAPLLPECSTTGEQNALVIAVNYQDDTTEVPGLATINDRYFNPGDSLASYWQEASYGKTTLTGVNLGWHTLDASITSSNACNMTNEIRQQAIDIAAQQTDISQYTRLFIVMRQLSGGCGFIGQGTLTCPILSSTDGTQAAHLSTHWVLGNVIQNAQSGLDIIAHEAGHNLGFDHAERLVFSPDSTGPILDNSGATILQQGDTYDPMGSSAWPAHYNAIHKQQAEWLDANNIQTANGTASIALQSLSKAASGVQSIQLYRGANAAGKKEYFVLETRSLDGFDALTSAAGVGAIHIHQLSDENDPFTYLIDANPQTPTLLDSAIANGDSFYDPFSGITISNQGLDVDGNVLVSISTDANLLDTDEDGVTAQMEAMVGSDNTLVDTDGDGDSDKWEICADGDCNTYMPWPGGEDLNATDPDTDGDGMFDRWERLNGLNAKDPSDASLDPDNDQITNLDEFLMGTDPQGGDSDMDGLPDGIEISIGSDTANPDTDADGMTDGWEYDNGLDPLDDSDAALDADNDTIDNLTEFNLGTSPISEDSDGDGLTDQDELNFYLTDPAKADTDDDRISDTEELSTGTDPLSISADSDGDGMNDDWENIRGTNVAVPDAVEDPDGDNVLNIIEYLRNSLPQSRASIPDLQTLYVDRNVAPAVEEGSESNPYTRIDRALDAALAGDTILVASGLYNSNTEQILNFNKHVHIKGPDDRSAVVQGIGVSMGGGLNWVLLENMSFNLSSFFGVMGNNAQLHQSVLDVGNGIVMQSTRDAIVSNNVLSNVGGARELGILNASNTRVLNNTLTSAALGIEQSSCTGTVLINNIVHNPDTLLGFPGDAMIRYNIFIDGDQTGPWSNIAGPAVFRDAASGDYRLAFNSPGVAMGDPSFNAELEPKANGNRVNMGAYGGTPFATGVIDADFDLLPDSWELFYGLSTSIANTFADDDNDGFSNYHEFWNSSQPNVNASQPMLANNDFDNDSFDDAIDNCPDFPNPGQEDSNGDGIGDACPQDVEIPTLNSLDLFWLALGLAFIHYQRRKLPLVAQ